MSEDIRVSDIVDFVDTVLILSDKQFNEFCKRVKNEFADNAILQLLNSAEELRNNH